MQKIPTMIHNQVVARLLQEPRVLRKTLADEFGISISQVSHIMDVARRRGIKIIRRKNNLGEMHAELYDKVRALLLKNNKLTNKQLGEITGENFEKVRRIIKLMRDAGECPKREAKAVQRKGVRPEKTITLDDTTFAASLGAERYDAPHRVREETQGTPFQYGVRLNGSFLGNSSLACMQ